MDDERSASMNYPQANEQQILKHIVNAMLADESELADATIQEWCKVIVDSCRLQKMALGSHSGLVLRRVRATRPFNFVTQQANEVPYRTEWITRSTLRSL